MQTCFPASKFLAYLSVWFQSVEFWLACCTSWVSIPLLEVSQLPRKWESLFQQVYLQAWGSISEHCPNSLWIFFTVVFVFSSKVDLKNPVLMCTEIYLRFCNPKDSSFCFTMLTKLPGSVNRNIRTTPERRSMKFSFLAGEDNLRALDPFLSMDHSYSALCFQLKVTELYVAFCSWASIAALHSLYNYSWHVGLGSRYIYAYLNSHWKKTNQFDWFQSTLCFSQFYQDWWRRPAVSSLIKWMQKGCFWIELLIQNTCEPYDHKTTSEYVLGLSCYSDKTCLPSAVSDALIENHESVCSVSKLTWKLSTHVVAQEGHQCLHRSP